MEEKNDHRPIVRLFQLIGFSSFFYMLVCVLLNYLMIALKYTNALSNHKKTAHLFDFKTAYVLNPPATMDLFMVLLISIVIGMLITMRLDTVYRITHDNKTIKGNDRFSTVKELDKTFYSFSDSDMTSATKSGIIIAHENGKFYIDAETLHSLIIGTTRSGKGQTFVMPMMRHICFSKAKHSMVINDPKGEMLENCYDMLIENGYKVTVLNLRDTEISSLWNPLQIIIDEYSYARKENKDLSKTIKLVQSLASVFTDNPKSDPIWPDSAKSLLVAMILYLLQKGYDDGHINNVSMYSVYQFFIDFGTKDEVRVVNGAKKNINALDEIFKNLQATDPTNPAVSAYSVSNFASGEMRSSIFSTLASNINIFGSDTGISKLTSGNQINFSELINPEKPMAIFMVVPDNDHSRYVISSLFVFQCYNTLVELSAGYKGQRLPQRVHFILDEFGNMVRIPDMDTNITVGAGRNILFNLFVQDLNQLDTKYDNAAKTIRSNCGNMVYINSLDADTNEYISKVLGTRTIEYTTYSGDLHSWLNHQSGVVDSQPLMTASQLSLMQFGSAVTKRQRCYPIKTVFEPFYKLGVQARSILDISQSMEIIDRPLSETIYPLDELWKPLFQPIIDNRSHQPVLSDDGSTLTAWNEKRVAIQKKNRISNNISINTDYSDKTVVKQPKTHEQILIEIIDEVSQGAFETAFSSNDWEGCKKIIKRAFSIGKLTARDKAELETYIQKFYNTNE